MKKCIFKKWQFALMLALILSMTFSFVGCLDNKDKATSVKNDDDNYKEGKESDDEEKTEFEQGETVKLKDVEYTVESAAKKKYDNRDKYSTAQKGSEYVIFKIKIVNKSEERVTYNPFYFRLENSKGQEKKPKYLPSDKDTRLDHGELTKNGSIEGTMTFEAPKNDKGLKLNYYEPGNSNEAAFKIKIDAK